MNEKNRKNPDIITPEPPQRIYPLEKPEDQSKRKTEEKDKEKKKI